MRCASKLPSDLPQLFTAWPTPYERSDAPCQEQPSPHGWRTNMPESPTGLIVAGVDGSAAAHCTARWAARDAERRNATLRLVHAVLPPPTGGYLEPTLSPTLVTERLRTKAN